MSSVAVPLIIIPMDLHDQWIEVEAYSSNRNDAIRKNLKVVVSLPCQHLLASAGITLLLYFKISNVSTKLHLRSIFFQSEGVLTKVEERVVEINPSEHPGAGSLETHSGYAMKMWVGILFKHPIPS